MPFLILCATCALIYGFTAKPGGDFYEIRLNNRVLFKQYLHQPSAVKTLSLPLSGSQDQITVFYSHCGFSGKSRSITVRDAQNNLLKKWDFKDAGASNNSMVLPVKELLELEKRSRQMPLKIYYSAKELPEGRMLVSLKVSEKSLASQQQPGKGKNLLSAGDVFRILLY